MVVQDARPGRVWVEGPIKGVMGRREQATDPAPSPGAAARTLGDRKEITGQANACRHGVALADCTRHRWAC